MQLVKNEDEIIVINFSFCNCMAQITVCDTDYVSFNYVSFEAATLDSQKALESGEPELVYLQVSSEKMSIIIHPDDIKKIDKVCFSTEHICVDVQCQYLVLRNDEVTFRILPQFFYLI